MIKNYFLTTLRNLGRNKVYSLINLSGLSVGIACCLLIFLYAKDELSFDKFHRNAGNIYRIVSVQRTPDGSETKMGVVGMMPGPAFHDEIPEIKTFVRLQGDGFAVRRGHEVFQQEAHSVDSNFFSVFSFPLVYGSPATVLSDPYSVVLSEETARKFFGRTDVIGETLELKLDTVFSVFKVTGVAKNPPQNSSIKFQMLVPISLKRSQGGQDSWLNFYLNTFVVMPPGADVGAVEKKMAASYERNAASQIKEMREVYNARETYKFLLQPFLHIHLSEDFKAQNG